MARLLSSGSGYRPQPATGASPWTPLGDFCLLHYRPQIKNLVVPLVRRLKIWTLATENQLRHSAEVLQAQVHKFYGAMLLEQSRHSTVRFSRVSRIRVRISRLGVGSGLAL